MNAQANNDYKVIGTRPIRPDGTDKVTGRAIYANDVHLPNMLHGKILRSPHAHARILSIDTRAAEKVPGVTAVVTRADFGEVSARVQAMGEGASSLRELRDNIIAHDKVLYHGHAVAAVAATSPHIAEEALKLIKVEYEVLPPVLDVRAAMQPDAPLLNAELFTDEMGKKGDKPSNIASHSQFQRGDLAKGFAEADVVVEREFKTAMVHQGYLEPHSSTVLWRQDERILVWTSTQGAFDIRSQVGELCAVPISNVKVTPTEIGGGFGGKFTAYTDVPAAILSKKSGHRPVKITMSRIEVLQATGPTSGSYIRVKIGARKDGTISAAEAELIYEAGAYPGSPVGAGAGVILSPYRLDNLLIDAYDVVNNKPKTGAYRAPGGTNAAFASEVVIDEVAEKLGIDPLEFRRINAVVEGDRSAYGPQFGRIGMLETVEAALRHPHYKAPLPGKNCGRGVASGFWFNGGGESSVVVTVNPDGKVNLIEGSTDIGGSRASAAMMLAETMGIPVGDVNPQVVDTDTIGLTSGTGGSSVTFKLGWTVYEAGTQMINKMRTLLADEWEVSEGDVHYAAGTFATSTSSTGDKKLSFAEAAKELSQSAPLSVTVTKNPEGVGPGFATHIVDVEVDPETGKVQILRYTAVQDVGKAIHPSYVEGQIQGGVAQGVGWALNEEYFYDKHGRMLNSSLLDYRMPTALDLPMIDAVMVEVANPGHPYGVRGVGEVPIVPPAAALANAIYRAAGVRLYELPMNSMKVLTAILEK